MLPVAIPAGSPAPRVSTKYSGTSTTVLALNTLGWALMSSVYEIAAEAEAGTAASSNRQAKSRETRRIAGMYWRARG